MLNTCIFYKIMKNYMIIRKITSNMIMGRVNDQVQHDVKLQQTFKELVFGCGKI